MGLRPPASPWLLGVMSGFGTHAFLESGGHPSAGAVLTPLGSGLRPPCPRPRPGLADGLRPASLLRCRPAELPLVARRL